MALSHRKEVVSGLCDGVHGSPTDVPETPRKGFAQLPPTNVKASLLRAGSVAECCVGSQRGKAVLLLGTQCLQG